MVSSKTKILGVFGFPVGHSLSPLMHNTALEKTGLDFVYLPFEVKPGSLGSAVGAVRALNIAGINVTIPHKENIRKYLNRLSSEARKIGAVNTVVNRNGLLTGFNTDYHGFLKSITEKTSLRNKSVLMLGCGGVAKAIAAALLDTKIKKLTVADIDVRKAKQFLGGNKKIMVINTSLVPAVLDAVDIFINATPVGMRKGDASPVNKKFLKKGLFVYDVVYNRETQLLKDAKKIGLKCCNGLDMFVYQGAASFKLWTGKNPPIGLMRKVVVKSLR